MIINDSGTDNIYYALVRIMMKKDAPGTRPVSGKRFDGDAW